MESGIDCCCEIVDRLYLSSLNGADAEMQRYTTDIGCVLSIGTNSPKSMPSNVVSLALDQPLDSPETLFMGIFFQGVKFINDFLTSSVAKKGVLVHCVNGQSRSAAVVVAYLLSRRIESGFQYNLNEAMQLLCTARPEMCINPGFLCQLHYLAHETNHSQRGVERGRSAYVRLLLQTERRTVTGLPLHASLQNQEQKQNISPDKSKLEYLRCRACRYKLCPVDDILKVEHDVAAMEFSRSYESEFWSQYSSYIHREKAKKSFNYVRNIDSIYICWQFWIQQQVFKENCGLQNVLICPKKSCKATVGSLQFHALFIAGEYLLVDSLKFSKAAIDC